MLRLLDRQQAGSYISGYLYGLLHFPHPRGSQASAYSQASLVPLGINSSRLRWACL